MGKDGKVWPIGFKITVSNYKIFRCCPQLKILLFSYKTTEKSVIFSSKGFNQSQKLLICSLKHLLVGTTSHYSLGLEYYMEKIYHSFSQLSIVLHKNLHNSKIRISQGFHFIHYSLTFWITTEDKNFLRINKWIIT